MVRICCASNPSRFCSSFLVERSALGLWNETRGGWWVIWLLTNSLRVKVSFHSRSQGSQASQQACVCDPYWYETWLRLTLRSSGRVCDIRSQVAHAQLLRTPTKFVGLLRGMETKYAGSQRSFVLEVQFWSYSFIWEVAKCDIHNYGIL